MAVASGWAVNRRNEMKHIITVILAAFALHTAAQTTEIEFRVDSFSTTRYYFVTSTVFTDTSTGNKQVQEFQRFFDNKDSVASYANLVRAAIRQDSILSKTNSVTADSSAARVDRLIAKYKTSGSFRSLLAPPPDPETIESSATQTGKAPAAKKTSKPKATKPRTKRIKNLKSE